MGFLKSIFGTYSSREVKRIQPICNAVLALEDKYSAMTDEELKGQTAIFKDRLSKGETLDDILPEAFATCREAAYRVLGMKHYPVQIIGGIVLHQGRIAEMRTGEGKTLVATLPAYLNGLSGNGVHIVTVNDYLAKRDSEWMGKIYEYLGLTVGLIVHAKDKAERRQAYACDITYGTNNEMGFDYLRDNMAFSKESTVQRKHNFCIVDEVDSILIDEARTPLIISGPGDKATDLYTQADKFAAGLSMFKTVELDDKVEHDDEISADYIVDEKAKTATLTQRGVKKAEQRFNVENLMDPDNIELLHHINQAIKARGIMKRDIDYVVKDGEVIIVDEFTGRLMLGRRYNEGLHQAIEAKEGVKVARESKTYATITFQNYFRLYSKLAGMTGTAMTEESEFREIYNLDVIEIPTNKPVVRIDHSDVIYKTEKGKFLNTIKQIKECHAKGQPVLVGTISIEKSEYLSTLLKREGIKHEVLNAKHHEREAEIVAQAGKFGAVTIATNMAGRGTDITLGGNAEFMAKSEMRKQGFEEEMIWNATEYFATDDEEILNARKVFADLCEKFKPQIAQEAEKVRNAGGLFILGTERHESRRIDNQLRGRAGRQGDPGESRFYVSLDDDLMRIFGGDRMATVMNTLKIDEDMPIESGIISKTLESSQAKIEGRNFSIRKNVLNYDDVMNAQREIIYKQRSEVLNGEDIKEKILKMIRESITDTVNLYLLDDEIKDDWNLEGLRDNYAYFLRPEDLSYTLEELEDVTRSDIAEKIVSIAMNIYDACEQHFGEERMRAVERELLLRAVDMKWIDHIDAMDQLKQGISLRSYGQHDPVVEYRIEGFDMFDEMVESIRDTTVRLVLTSPLYDRANEQRKIKVEIQMKENLGGSSDGTVNEQAKSKKVGRNDPCPCGSGKKYKNCCGQ